MEDREYRVGALAKRAGLTVRTLHHWEEVGLLSPSRRTRSGHRLYGPEAVRRLQRIRSLKALGLGLDQIRRALESSASTLEGVLEAHRDQVRNQLRMLKTLEDRLERTLELLKNQGRVPDEELIRTMELMTLIETHFTSEQLDFLRARRDSLGDETIKNAQAEWPRLIRRMTEEMERGTDPATPEVQKLASQWRALIHAFSGGNRAIEDSVAGMYRARPSMAAEQGLGKDLFEYLGRALKEGE